MYAATHGLCRNIVSCETSPVWSSGKTLYEPLEQWFSTFFVPRPIIDIQYSPPTSNYNWNKLNVIQLCAFNLNLRPSKNGSGSLYAVATPGWKPLHYRTWGNLN